MVIKFEVTPEDAAIIDKIVARIGEKYVYADKMFLTMDMCAAHNITPLDLQVFLDADDGNFFHDAGGITNNLDRRTGEFKNLFHPRFAKQQ